MKFIKMVQEAKANSDAIPALSRALRQTVGNKVYMRDVDEILKRLEPLDARDNETIWYLIRDLKNG